jgi:hypothetical protein
MNSAQYSVRARLDLALVPEGGSTEAVMAPVMARKLAGEARSSVELLSPSRDRRVREALERVLDAVEVLESEMEWVWRRQLNASRGMVLQPTWVTLTPQGLILDDPLEPGPGTVQLGIVLAGSWRLLALPVCVEGHNNGSFLRLQGLREGDRDTLAALVLDIQRKERRRERSQLD